MSKRIVRKSFQISISLIFLSTLAYSQTANNWINYSQVYYRIPVAKDGVYRLTYEDLSDPSKGFPVSSVNPAFIQIFHRGVEQAIYFQQNPLAASDKFESGEFLEFYGQRNDGTLDSKLYKPVSAQPHPYYNLYSDTSAYFLTWNLTGLKGKRMTPFSAVNTGPILPKETSQTAQQLAVYTQEYGPGEMLSDVIQYSYFNAGEGWTGSTICTLSSGCTGQQDFIIDNLTGTVTSASPPQLQLQLAGRDDLGHSAEIYVGANAGALRLVATQTFVNYETPTINASLNWSDVGVDGKMTVRVKALGVGGIRDRMSVSYIKVDFSQNFDMTGVTEKKFKLAPNANAKSYAEIINAPAATRVWDITDLNTISSITDPNPGSILKLIVAGTSLSHTLLVTKADQFITPKFKKISFRQINPASHDYLIITNKVLQKPGLGYANAVQSFAAYRASEQGGGYDTLVVTTEQLYNQFNYGETSSLAIYEFMKYMYAGGKPKYLFIIGKGREINAAFFRKTTVAINEYRDLVPPAGLPASDLTYTAGLSGTEHLPAVPTGRIPASNAAEVAAYLNKVIETEASSFDEQWHKQVLHLSGGIESYELGLFRQYMDGFAAIAEGDYYGGSVKTLGKHEATAIELINIAKEVNSGVNMVTFYGHSAPNNTDIDIGFATDPAQGYNNPGKYPSFLVNGCNAGEFFGNFRNFGEDWILAPNKGARNFIANTSYGFPNQLKYFTELFYSSAFADSVGIRSGIGNVHIQVAKRYLATSTDISSVAMAHQMILLGDPALKIFGAGKPDFDISDQSLSAIGFDGNPVSASADSFALKIVIKNLGLITKDPLRIRVTRKLTDNTTFTYDSIYQTQPANQDTLTFVIKHEVGKNFVNNLFLVNIDPDNKIEELSKSNNKASLTLSIPGTKNLFPDQYGIVSKKEVDLVFQNTNLLSTDRQYSIQLDTINTFNSPSFQQYTMTGKTLLKKKIQLLEKDSTVYYWRTRLTQPAADENAEWKLSSFAYINNSPEGWAQMHFPQFMDDTSSGLVKDPAIRKLQFEKTSIDIFIKTFGKDNTSPAANAALTFNGVDYWHSIQDLNCRRNTINLVAFNRNTVVPYQGVPFTFRNSGGRACGREPQLINSFLPGETDTGLGDDLVQYVNNINEGDSVIFFTLGDAGLDLWSSNVKNKIAEFGLSATQINSIQSGEPVIIFGKKGAAAGTAKIIRSSLSPAPDRQLVLNKILTGNIPSGSLQSTMVGPAQKWKQFISKVADKEASDEIRFDLYGVRADGHEALIQSDMGNSFDLSSIATDDYPFLKLVYATNDNAGLTPAQLKKWFILFDPVAEGLLVYKGPLTQQTFQEGLSWTGNYSFVNISGKTFTDSLKVETDFFNKSNQSLEKSNFKIKAPAPGDSTQFQIKKYPKAGLSNIDVFVNRRILPELFYDNNSLTLTDYLNISSDNISPIMDVTVDGRYLQNGDYTSSNPAIVLLMKDENPYLFKTDTIGMDIFMKYPCAQSTCEFKKIKFKSDDIKWYPASATSDFRIEFNPKNLADGEYTLRAQLQDATGNKTGSSPFEVKFIVLSETTISFIPAFPNPSSADFFLRFTLTGQYDLDDFNLQIYSPDGRLINSFDKESLSRLHVGTHELKWDAKDSSGSAVPPGIYIYNMRISANGVSKTSREKFVVIR